MPRELRAPREQLVGEIEDADEPVRPHLELDRALRALGHRHLLLDLLRAAERAGGFEVGDDPFARRVDVETGVLAGDLGQLARGVDAEPQREPVALPALHVGAVAEGADHHESGTELGANLFVGEDGHLVAGDRDDRVLIGEGCVPLVVGVEVQRDTTRDELGPGRRDHEVAAVRRGERDVVQRGVARDRLEVGLRERRLHRRIPEHRFLGPVDAALLEQVEERALRGTAAVVVDRRVAHAPVDRQPELAPEPLVPDGDFRRLREAQRAELGAGRAGLVDLVLLLDVALRRQAVVVEAHRIEDVAAPHPHVADDELRLRVRHRVADVEVRRRYVGRRRVDGEDRAGRLGVEPVDPRLLPAQAGALLDRREIGCLVETHGSFSSAPAAPAASLENTRRPLVRSTA